MSDVLFALALGAPPLIYALWVFWPRRRLNTTQRPPRAPAVRPPATATQHSRAPVLAKTTGETPPPVTTAPPHDDSAALLLMLAIQNDVAAPVHIETPAHTDTTPASTPSDCSYDSSSSDCGSSFDGGSSDGGCGGGGFE